MKNLSVFTLITLIILASCTTDTGNEKDVDNNINKRGITITVPDFKNDADTRTSVQLTDNAVKFLWSENDTVGIFPEKGCQVFFPMESGAGTNTAAFDGGGWALKPSAAYSAYYPFVDDYHLDITKIPVSFGSQDQNVNEMQNAARHDYLAAKTVTPSEGKVNFEMKHMCCLLEINISAKFDIRANSITLKHENPFYTTEGYIDLSASVPAICPTKQIDSIKVSFPGYIDLFRNANDRIYLMIAPVNMEGKDIRVSAGLRNGVIKGRNFQAGNAYRLDVIWDDKLPENPSVPENLKWVDMGLSVKWAKFNVGASDEIEEGYTFAWGEVVPRNLSSVFDYNCITTPGRDIPDFSGNPELDAATAWWGTDARTPTSAEFIELLQNCEMQKCNLNDVPGFMFTSKINKNYIFFSHLTERVEYWTSTPYTSKENLENFSDAMAAVFWALEFVNTPAEIVGWTGKNNLYHVRPVLNEKKK